MVKYCLILLLSLSTLCAKGIYERNCVSCHDGMTITLDKFFFRYLLKYSSEKEVKKALIEYLKNPKAETSILDTSLIVRIGVKKRTSLSDKELQEAVDEYWETYKVFDKLK